MNIMMILALASMAFGLIGFFSLLSGFIHQVELDKHMKKNFPDKWKSSKSLQSSVKDPFNIDVVRRWKYLVEDDPEVDQKANGLKKKLKARVKFALYNLAGFLICFVSIVLVQVFSVIF